VVAFDAHNEVIGGTGHLQRCALAGVLARVPDVVLERPVEPHPCVHVGRTGVLDHERRLHEPQRGLARLRGAGRDGEDEQAPRQQAMQEHAPEGRSVRARSKPPKAWTSHHLRAIRRPEISADRHDRRIRGSEER
jgi:hypothetical protein